MNSPTYLYSFFKTNQLTGFFLLFLSICPFFNHLRLPAVVRKHPLWAAMILGLSLRIGWLFFSSHVMQGQWNPQHMLESDVANVHAIELATKGIWFHDAGGVPSGRRPIGYPILIALAYKLFGVHSGVIDLLNLALFAAGLYFLYKIARLLFSERVAFWSAILYALYPVSIYSIKLATDEHLFMPLWLGGLYLLLREIHGRPVRAALLWYGLIFGYAAMTRTHAVFMPATVALAYFLIRYPWKKVLAAFFGVAILMQLINLPWIVRNYQVWGHPIPYSTNNYFIYRTFNLTATPEGGGHIPEKGEEDYSEALTQAKLSGNEGAYHVACGREITRFILRHPLRFLDLGFSRAFLFMGWNRTGVWPIWFQYYDGSFNPERPLDPRMRHALEETAYFSYYALFFCFISALVLFFRRRKMFSAPLRHSLLVLGSCFIFWILEHFVIFVDRKYRFPLEVLMIVAACYFLDFWVFEFKPWTRLRAMFMPPKKSMVS